MIMRKIILLLLLIITSLSAKTQCNLPYKPLSAFGTDTVAFMTYNFKDRADCYKGKTLKNVVDDLQIPVIYFTSSPLGRGDGMYPDEDNSIAIWIYIYTSDYVQYARFSENIFNSLYIEWENIVPENAYTKSSKDWNPEVYNYLKDKKIKGIIYIDRIIKPKVPKSTGPDPRIRLKRRR